MFNCVPDALADALVAPDISEMASEKNSFIKSFAAATMDPLVKNYLAV